MSILIYERVRIEQEDGMPDFKIRFLDTDQVMFESESDPREYFLLDKEEWQRVRDWIDEQFKPVD